MIQYLGGKDNYKSDRAASDGVLKVWPDPAQPDDPGLCAQPDLQRSKSTYTTRDPGAVS